ncbi:MAG: MalY/PatB family protein [Stackebrandtia sp.]
MTDACESPFEELSLDRLRRRTSAKWRWYAPDVLPLWVAEMDTPLAPSVARALRDAVDLGDTGYALDGDFPSAFAGFARRRYDWDVPQTAPRLTADVMTGLAAALEAVTDPGDAVVISTPIYPPFYTCLERLKLRAVSSPLRHTPDGFGLDLNRLERDFASGARAYLMCNPHNPCGLALTREELEAVAALADRHDVTVVSDEIHAPLTVPGRAHIPFASLDSPSAARSFTAVAASKAWNLPGLKAALLVPGAEADVSALPDDMWVGAGLFGVLAGQAAFSEGEEWLDSVRDGIDERRKLLAELLAAQLPRVRYTPPQATYLAWLDFRDCGLDGDPAEVLCERGRVALYSGPRFGPEGTGFARLNLATSRDVIAEAVRRMAKVIG